LVIANIECPQEADANSLADHKLQQALLYARDFGWPVFPCHSIRNGKCSCGKADCAHPAKHPRTRNGLSGATTDAEQIRKWWEKWPDANVAIATGNGLLVIDVDPRHGGDATVSELETRLGELPRWTVVATGGGGQHFYFSVPEDAQIRTRGHWKPGIDTRAEGGYVIAPPSNHVSGGKYEWSAPLQLPEIVRPLPKAWLRELPLKLPATSKRHEHQTLSSRPGVSNRKGIKLARGGIATCHSPDNSYFPVSLSVSDDVPPEVTQRLNAAIELATVREPGTRHHQLLRLGCLLHRIPELRAWYAEDFESIVRRWFNRSLPKMLTKDWRASWDEWLEIWPWVVQHPQGAPVEYAYQVAMERPLPLIGEQLARKYSLRSLGELVALCCALQELCADDNGIWFLGCRTAAEIIGVKHKLANKWLNLLVEAGVLEQVGEHVLGSRKAQRYRYIGDRTLAVKLLPVARPIVLPSGSDATYAAGA